MRLVRALLLVVVAFLFVMTLSLVFIRDTGSVEKLVLVAVAVLLAVLVPRIPTTRQTRPSVATAQRSHDQRGASLRRCTATASRKASSERGERRGVQESWIEVLVDVVGVDRLGPRRAHGLVGPGPRLFQERLVRGADAGASRSAQVR